LKNVRLSEAHDKQSGICDSTVGLPRVLHLASMHLDNKVEGRSSLTRILSNDASSYTKLRHVDEGLKVVFIYIIITLPNPFRRAGNPYRRTPEGEPLEGTGFSRPFLRVIVPILIGIIIISIVAI
jgi:hypothetical protein